MESIHTKIYRHFANKKQYYSSLKNSYKLKKISFLVKDCVLSYSYSLRKKKQTIRKKKCLNYNYIQ